MKKKHLIWPLFMVICISLTLFGQATSVLANQEKSDVGISFNQFTEPEKVKPPIYETKPNSTISGELPHLGQMMTSFILLLLGVACLIILLGVISLRKIYRLNI